MGTPPKWHLSSRKSERPDARLLWLLSQPQASCLPWRGRVFMPPETPGGAMRLKAQAGGAELPSRNPYMILKEQVTFISTLWLI